MDGLAHVTADKTFYRVETAKAFLEPHRTPLLRYCNLRPQLSTLLGRRAQLTVISVTQAMKTLLFLYACLLFRRSQSGEAPGSENYEHRGPQDLLLRLSKVLVVQRTELLIMRFGVIRWILSWIRPPSISQVHKRISGLECPRQSAGCSTRPEQQLSQTRDH